MILRNVTLLPGNETLDIKVSGKRITSANNNESNELELVFENAIAFPGLINSHDHLDFNLFPKLGDPPYDNYAHWGMSIHKNFKSDVDEVLQIPLPLRLEWGLYKNLLCGVTTVVQHGHHFTDNKGLISVINNFQCLHSVQFEKNWILKLNDPRKHALTVVMHVGEGLDQSSHREINKIIRFNLMGRPLVGVHGIAMDPRQAADFKALIWCPASNYFLFDKTANIKLLGLETLICFGTDSTLTAPWNIWDHIKMARASGNASDLELYNMLTVNPSILWKQKKGKISPGYLADLVIARPGIKLTGLDAFFALNIEDILLILHEGEIKLIDHVLFEQVGNLLNDLTFTEISINGIKKSVAGNLRELITQIQMFVPRMKFPVTLQ